MRCNNCGHMNSSGSRCEKCNAPLKGSMVGNENHPNIDVPEQQESNLGKTIAGKDASALPWDCPNCGYPVIAGSKSCSKCGFDFATNSVVSPNPKVEPMAEQKPEQKAVTEEPSMRSRGKQFAGTVDPYQKGCFLKPIATNFESEMEAIKIKASSNETEIGREMLGADNSTISSHQANLLFHNGKWLIKDCSTNGSTFVHASDYLELQEGDIIMMGDRRFVFSTK